jgi:PTS system nitrogen regulatory IIA component
MEISNLLSQDAVRLMSSVSSKKRLFQELGEIAAPLCGIRATDACAALQERESLGPTGVGHGVALPHARLPGLERVQGVFVRLEKPVDFDAVDKKPVDLIFALFAPDGAGVDHLKALAVVSRTMREPGLLAKLRANTDPITLHAILTDKQAHQAA